jgi:hypothetical protein
MAPRPSRFRARTAQNAADLYANPWAMFNGSGASAGCGLYVVQPCRAVDTRAAAGPLGAPSLLANGTRGFPIGAQYGIPSDALAVSTNLTVVAPAAAGFLTFTPAGPPTGTSAIDFSPGQTVANNAVVLLRGGVLDVANGSNGGLDLLVDVNGYFK